MIESILAFTTSAAHGVFKIILILILIIGVIRLINAVKARSFTYDHVLLRAYHSIAAAILVSGSLIALAIMYSS